jgi:5'-nucleotidase
MTEPTHALITNDDGIESEGLALLARCARDAGLEVVVAAPDKNVSGASASLSALETDGRVLVEECRLAGLADVPAFALAASPAFIALLATRGGLGAVPDVILSGINRGHNTGQAILHSGTVGAAFTGAAYGCRAMAVSLVVGEPLQWATAVQVVRDILPALLVAPPGTVANLNVPNVELAQLRGVRRATLAKFGAVQTNVAEIGRGYVTIELVEPDAELEPGTDAALLAGGWATVSTLQSIYECNDVWFNETLDAAPISDH